MTESIESSNKSEKKITTSREKGTGWSLFSRTLLVVALFVIASLFIWTEWNRQETKNELQEARNQIQELQQLSERSNEDISQDVLAQAREHIDIPEEDNPSVATIVNVEQLREQNAFYDKAQNGDFLIVTAKRAILFSMNRNVVLDVVPVVVNESSEESVTPAP